MSHQNIYRLYIGMQHNLTPLLGNAPPPRPPQGSRGRPRGYQVFPHSLLTFLACLSSFHTTDHQRESYKLEAIAEDMGASPLSRTVEVQIDVVDRSNKPPVWDQVVYGPIYVKENTAVGQTVTTVKARSVFRFGDGIGRKDRKRKNLFFAKTNSQVPPFFNADTHIGVQFLLHFLLWVEYLCQCFTHFGS